MIRWQRFAVLPKNLLWVLLPSFVVVGLFLAVILWIVWDTGHLQGEMGAILERLVLAALVALVAVATLSSVAAWQAARYRTTTGQAEQSLQESRRTLATLVDNLPGMVFRCRNDRNWSMQFVGPGCRTLTGYGPRELTEGPVSYADLIHPEDREAVWRAVQAAVAIGEPFQLEYRIKTRDGDERHVWAQGRAVDPAEADATFLEGLVLDVSDRCEDREAVRRSETRYRQLVENANSIILRRDMAGNITFFNEYAQNFFGYEQREILGRHMVGTILPETDGSGRDMRALVRDVAQDPAQYANHECESIRRNGEIVRIAWASKAILDDNGQVVEMLCVGNDVTGARRAEAARAAAESQFRALVEQSIVGIYATDGQRFVYANPKFAEILGYSQEELISSIGPMDVAAPEERDRVTDNIRQRLEGDVESLRYSARVIRKDGQAIRVEVHGTRAEFQGRRVILGIALDITERMRVEAERARLGMAVEQAVESIIIADADGTVQYVNPAFERTSGYSSAEAIGRSIRVVKTDKHDEAFYRKMWETLSRGEIWSGDFVRKRKDGTLYEEEVTMSPIRDPNGRVLDFVAVCRNVTEERQVAEQLRQSQKMEAIGRLAGGVSHDFNNLLTAIMGYGDMALGAMRPDDPVRGAIEEIQKAGQRAASLTRQLLVFSRRQVLEPKVVDLNAVIADMEKMLLHLIGEDIDLVVVADPAAGCVKADRGQLEQVVMNLAVNARDAIPRGGRLTIETADLHLDEPYTGDHAIVDPGQYVVLTVSDTGCGMDEATLSHVFEPFFTTKEQGKGTGLGLATVYGIVTQSGGQIGVHTEPDRGTSFKVYLPRVEGPDQTATPHGPSQEVPRGSETILLVEDEDGVRKLASTILRQCGYDVLEASHAGEALLVVERHADPIDLMVTDVVMPHMNGPELYNRLAPDRPDMKVLYISGHADDAVVRHGVLDRTTTFLQKPFTGTMLARVVREVLDGSTTVADDREHGDNHPEHS